MWTGEALSFSHVTGDRVSTFQGRASSDALVGVDVAVAGSHVAGVLGGVHTPVVGEIEIQDGCVTHVSKYNDTADLLLIFTREETRSHGYTCPRSGPISNSQMRLSLVFTITIEVVSRKKE